jgi:hypothetical protein
MAASLGKMPMTSVRRFISQIGRSQEVRLARATLFAASGRGNPLNAAFSAANATYPRSGCRGHALKASRACGATFRCCRPVGASRQAGGGPQYAARETGYACCLGHELPNAIAGAASNIELLCADGWPCTLQPAQRTEMRIGQIADVDEIADAGAIMRRIVVA